MEPVMTDALKQVVFDLAAQADLKKAKILSGFFKVKLGEYGEGDRFLGITVPKQRIIAKSYAARLDLNDLATLIKSRWHEERLTALLILVEKFKTGDATLQERIFSFYLKYRRYINNWDLVDLGAPKIVGAYLEDKDKSVLYEMAGSISVWDRRIAILATFHFIKKGDASDALKIIFLLKNDPHDLIRKAAGWMLREIGKNCGQNIEEEFLLKHYRKMPRVMLRYAIERFGEEKRKFYLKKDPAWEKHS